MLSLRCLGRRRHAAVVTQPIRRVRTLRRTVVNIRVAAAIRRVGERRGLILILLRLQLTRTRVVEVGSDTWVRMQLVRRRVWMPR